MNNLTKKLLGVYLNILKTKPFVYISSLYFLFMFFTFKMSLGYKNIIFIDVMHISVMLVLTSYMLDNLIKTTILTAGVTRSQYFKSRYALNIVIIIIMSIFLILTDIGIVILKENAFNKNPNVIGAISDIILVIPIGISLCFIFSSVILYIDIIMNNKILMYLFTFVTSIIVFIVQRYVNLNELINFNIPIYYLALIVITASIIILKYYICKMKFLKVDIK